MKRSKKSNDVADLIVRLAHGWDKVQEDLTPAQTRAIVGVADSTIKQFGPARIHADFLAGMVYSSSIIDSSDEANPVSKMMHTAANAGGLGGVIIAQCVAACLAQRLLDGEISTDGVAS